MLTTFLLKQVDIKSRMPLFLHEDIHGFLECIFADRVEVTGLKPDDLVDLKTRVYKCMEE